MFETSEFCGASYGCQVNLIPSSLFSIGFSLATTSAFLLLANEASNILSSVSASAIGASVVSSNGGTSEGSKLVSGSKLKLSFNSKLSSLIGSLKSFVILKSFVGSPPRSKVSLFNGSPDNSVFKSSSSCNGLASNNTSSVLSLKASSGSKSSSSCNGLASNNTSSVLSPKASSGSKSSSLLSNNMSSSPSSFLLWKSIFLVYFSFLIKSSNSLITSCEFEAVESAI